MFVKQYDRKNLLMKNNMNKENNGCQSSCYQVSGPQGK